ncbi:MAG TPA: BPL-N domain-containing protein [Gemmataceae bacterium]|nr:BPL-N domain-containing protein [Gemmataceae bacterium]
MAEKALLEHSKRSIRNWMWRLIVGGAIGCLCAGAYPAWQYARHATSAGLRTDELTQSFCRSPECREDPQIRVAVFKEGDDIQPSKHLTDVLGQSAHVTWQYVSGADMRAGALDTFHVVVFPGGNALNQSEALKSEGKDAVRAYVSGGGGYVGICAGAYLATAQCKWGLGMLDAPYLSGDIDVPDLGIRLMSDRGVGNVQLEFTGAGLTVLGSLAKSGSVRYTNGPIFRRAPMLESPKYLALAYFRTETAQYDQQRGTMIDTPAIIADTFGDGRVIAISPHPEMSSGLEFVVERAVLAAARR